MKIAVTGGTGFVGSGLVEVLLNRGDAVLVVTRSLSSLPVPFRGLVDVVTWEELDLSGIDG
ncbi:MAG: NAD-dependent epimerase/dehydratase family protein, partial [Planctomycetota bacterium]